MPAVVEARFSCESRIDPAVIVERAAENVVSDPKDSQEGFGNVLSRFFGPRTRGEGWRTNQHENTMDGSTRLMIVIIVAFLIEKWMDHRNKAPRSRRRRSRRSAGPKDDKGDVGARAAALVAARHR